jgi:hypothetical protein
MRKLFLILLITIGLVLTGCGDESSSDSPGNIRGRIYRVTTGTPSAPINSVLPIGYSAETTLDVEGRIGTITLKSGVTITGWYEYSYTANDDIEHKVSFDPSSGNAVKDWYQESHTYNGSFQKTRTDNYVVNYTDPVDPGTRWLKHQSYYVYQYYPSGLLQKITQYAGDDNGFVAPNTMIRYNEYEYDASDNLTKQTYTYNCHTTPAWEYSVYTYDGNVITRTHYNSSDVLQWTRKTEIEPVQELIEQVDQYNSGGTMTSSESYNYQTVPGDESNNDWFNRLQAEYELWN